MAQTIEALIEGGKATPGPPLGPALGPLGVNIMEIISEINKRTTDFVGMKVPVKVTVDARTKEFSISVGTPPTSSLILQELDLEKGSDEQHSNFVGNLTLDQVKKIARMKGDTLLGVDLKARINEILGTCLSMGITVEGMRANAFQQELKNGKIIVE